MAHEPYVGNDIYCDWILSGKLPVEVVAETDEVLAFHHSRPFWPVHLVVIPKAHTPSLVDLGEGGEELKLLGVPGDDPGQATCPCRESAVALLCARAPVTAIDGVEDALVSHAPPQVVDVPPFPVEHVVTRGRPGMFDEAAEQAD